MTTSPIPIMNYFVIILIILVFAVGITPISDTEVEKIKEASRVMGVMLSIICVLIGLIILYTPRETETLNNTPVV